MYNAPYTFRAWPAILVRYKDTTSTSHRTWWSLAAVFKLLPNIKNRWIRAEGRDADFCLDAFHSSFTDKNIDLIRSIKPGTRVIISGTLGLRHTMDHYPSAQGHLTTVSNICVDPYNGKRNPLIAYISISNSEVFKAAAKARRVQGV